MHAKISKKTKKFGTVKPLRAESVKTTTLNHIKNLRVSEITKNYKILLRIRSAEFFKAASGSPVPGSHLGPGPSHSVV